MHLVKPEGAGDWDAVITEVRAVCGATALIGPDGLPMPHSFDFVEAPDIGGVCNCPICLDTPDVTLQLAVEESA